jgi:hypothetical protein
MKLMGGTCGNWSERRDLNSRPPVPQTGALTGLRYAPLPKPENLRLFKDVPLHARNRNLRGQKKKSFEISVRVPQKYGSRNDDLDRVVVYDER